ncbi:cell envelope integrity protein CreD [Sphingobacteriales bacterium UPWRP_1]|nr:cell envelope integrity protein CreD [Sphingobacteriales bacterium TSM_CSM]PSJ74370.1 cell envelope integrity protein CreD [Sphingobacteriales bacterium UPWRP_1]
MDSQEKETTTQNHPAYNAATAIKTSVTVKMFAVGFLILLMLIPAAALMMLIDERQTRRNEAVAEVSSKWGNMQEITGPVLSIPFTQYVKDPNGQTAETTQHIHFLPDELNITGSIQPEIRYRGIYRVILYTARLTVSGSFAAPDLGQFSIPDKDLHLNRAFVAVGIPDMRGIKETVALTWNTDSLSFDPGIPAPDVAASGVSVRVPLAGQTPKYTFSFNLQLNGSEALQFAPMGKVTTVQLQSPWENPSFDGAFLPDERQISPGGFTAQWKVLHLNRNYPQQWQGNTYNVAGSMFGVKLIQPVDEYQKTSRAAKYAVMFIMLTFTVFFFVEVLNRKNIHTLQYLLVGAALCLFYLLLLSLTEQMDFGLAYLVSGTATVALITAYSGSVFGNSRLTALLFALLLALYLFLYFVLQLQDYALLMGSIGLFVFLAVIMYASRNVDWYNAGKLPGN